VYISQSACCRPRGRARLRGPEAARLLDRPVSSPSCTCSEGALCRARHLLAASESTTRIHRPSAASLMLPPVCRSARDEKRHVGVLLAPKRLSVALGHLLARVAVQIRQRLAVPFRGKTRPLSSGAPPRLSNRPRGRRHISHVLQVAVNACSRVYQPAPSSARAVDTHTAISSAMLATTLYAIASWQLLDKSSVRTHRAFNPSTTTLAFRRCRPVVDVLNVGPERLSNSLSWRCNRPPPDIRSLHSHRPQSVAFCRSWPCATLSLTCVRRPQSQIILRSCIEWSGVEQSNYDELIDDGGVAVGLPKLANRVRPRDASPCTV